MLKKDLEQELNRTKLILDYAREELKLKENIIKEARQYIENHIRIDDEYPDYMEMLLEEYNELLEILDKVGDEK